MTVPRGLIYADPDKPGITRLKRGNEFAYQRSNGRPVREASVLARIRSLAIPPAWTDVWICSSPNGHLQATGRDARGRKQYRYHVDWQAERGARKYDRTIAFAEALPRLRRIIRADLALPGFPRQKVIALVVALLGQTLLRVGNASYEKQNRSYGITTLRSAHARFVAGGQVRFAFRGKGGLQLESTVNDQRLVRLVRRIQQLPGQALFQYQEAGEVQQVTSGDVNDYLQAHLGGPFTAKDFRTWGATVRAIAFLACQDTGERVTGRAFNRCVASTAKHVAEALGNTPAVCRKSYINPIVFEAWREKDVEKLVPRGPLSPARLEKVALALLRERERH
jgi:DNA topoisomerase-1